LQLAQTLLHSWGDLPQRLQDIAAFVKYITSLAPKASRGVGGSH
jgi:hypothetical protein